MGVAFSASVLLSDGASLASEPGFLWVDMGAAPDHFETDGFLAALRLRLPDWKVVVLPDELDEALCRRANPGDYVVRIETDHKGDAQVGVVACASSTEILQETIPKKMAAEDGYRRGAVLVGVALDSKGEVTLETEGGPLKTNGRVLERTRPFGTIGGAFALSVVPESDKSLFSGIFDLGGLFPNGLWPKFGFKFSTRLEGTSSKGDRAVLWDRVLWLGLCYRMDFKKRWFLYPGLFLKYSHPGTEDIGEEKFDVDEDSLLSRFGVKLFIGGGVQIWRFFSVVVEVSPSFSFAERKYLMRDRVAVNMGIVTLDFTLGVQFYL